MVLERRLVEVIADEAEREDYRGKEIAGQLTVAAKNSRQEVVPVLYS